MQAEITAACASDSTSSDTSPMLKPYQLIGVNFLLLLRRQNIGGAICADEMGLGKTVQAITYLGLLSQEIGQGPHLVVCPASLLENWSREFKIW
jgi:SWI/SNF-related matrix-associated actin-dependent regulator 1 of chromatin subfamily A